MTFDVAVAIAVLAGLLWLWLTGMRARELATAAAKRVCREHEAQLLDQAVALRRLDWVRDDQGRLRVRRWFIFEYSRDGSHRHVGRVVLSGARVIGLQLEDEQGTIIWR